MNREGCLLLRALIDRSASLTPLVKKGDCKSIAAEVNAWLPSEMALSPADVYSAIKDRHDFGGPKMNVEILRARIDAMPVLTSARLSGDHQAILNELNFDPEIAGKVTIAEVVAAMNLRRVPRPTQTTSGAAAMVGTARL